MENAYSRRICGKEGRFDRLKRPLTLGVPLAFLYAYLYPYFKVLQAPLCSVKLFTGVDCPGCGVIRSVSFLLHGDLAASFRSHPLGIVVVALALYLWGSGLFDRDARLARSVQFGFLGALLLVWIWRLI